MSDGVTYVANLSDFGQGTQVRTIAELGTFWADPVAAIENSDHRSGVSLRRDEVIIVPPVLPDARVICIGVNFPAHAAEGSYRNKELPPYPTLFARWTRSLSIDGASVPVPSNEDGLDWEGEVAAYVGRTLIDVDASDARDSIIGYSVFNDITARRAQKLTSQWILGKNGDNSGPLGPMVTKDEVGDLRDGLRIQTRVNGATVQDGNTRDMTYELGEVLSLVSKSMTLRPGDLVCTGTPAGVGYARNPPWLLHPGDVVEVEVERLGILTNPIVANETRAAANMTNPA